MEEWLHVKFVISFLVRFILHPIGCKARKHKHCCLTCEWYKYLWTVVFVGVGLVAFLYTRDNNLGIKAIVDRLIDFKSWTFKTAEGKVLIVLDEANGNVELAGRNLPYACVENVNHVSVYQMKNSSCVIITKDAIERYEEVLK